MEALHKKSDEILKSAENISKLAKELRESIEKIQLILDGNTKPKSE